MRRLRESFDATHRPFRDALEAAGATLDDLNGFSVEFQTIVHCDACEWSAAFSETEDSIAGSARHARSCPVLREQRFTDAIDRLTRTLEAK
jgi:hypothetical protein